MIIKGKYNEAKVFTEVIDEEALTEVKEMCDTDFLEGSKIRMMPDVHAGKGSTIGTTMTIQDKVVPNYTGVDLGCGILTVKLIDREVDLSKLDEVIKEHVPSGSKNYNEPRYESEIDIKDFTVKNKISKERVNSALGTLGGGNHFIELSKDSKGEYYLTIHTGSRYLGHVVATEHQKIANTLYTKTDIKNIVDKLKEEGRHKEIQKELEKIKSENKKIKGKDMYLEGKELENYLHDVGLAQQFAKENREKIATTILEETGLRSKISFDTIHNYIDLDRMILRKGAVSAEKGEILIIPINMLDGSIICVGKGNEDWNYSAPHGAGRVLSRKKARESLDLKEFKEQMKDVYTSTVSEGVLDEAPGAYKRKEDIVDNIGDTVDILEHLTPVYNFKADEGLPYWMKKKK